MSDETNKQAGFHTFLESWMKTSNDYLESMMRMMGPGRTGKGEESGGEDAFSGTRFQESMGSALKAWQAISAALADSEAMDAHIKGMSTLPEILAKLGRTGLDGFFQMQARILERAGKLSETARGRDFETLDREAFKAWYEIYEKEFRPFLNIPQVGLARFYQERVNAAIDKYNVFQTAMAEFLFMLYLPMERSQKVMQDKLAEMAEAGDLSGEFQDYYRMWIKVLEGHYMKLFKSSDYTETLARTLEALEEFSAAKNAVLSDALKSLPIPTQAEMDELYKEIYNLKKRIWSLEKAMKKQNGPEQA